MFLGVLVGPQAVVAGDDEPGDGLRSDDIAADVFDTPPRDQIDVGPPLGLLNATGRVTVEIVHTPGADQDIRNEVARFDGRVLGESPGVILAEVPSARVPTLDRRSDVEYVRVYEDMLSHTSTELAPWYVIPADRKWFTRACIADIITTRIEALDLAHPTVSEADLAALKDAREKLEREA